jgi:hypothetical protein
MDRKHSWNWLPARFTGFAFTPTQRPPLATLEQLEDRMLLSAAVDGGGTPDQVLISLLKGQLDLRGSEINFLKIAGGSLVGDKTAPDTFLNIQQDVFKIDDAVGKLMGNTVIGDKSDTGQKYLTVKLETVIITGFADIENKLTDLGENSDGQLLPAIQKIQDATHKFTDSLKFIPGGILDNKLAASFNKIELDLGQINDAAGKVSFGDIVIPKHIDKSSPVLMQKISDSFVKIETDIAGFATGGDLEDLNSAVDTLKVNTLDLLSSLAPPVITPDGGFAGGVTTTNTGDVIS